MRFSGVWEWQARGHWPWFYGCREMEGWGVRISLFLVDMNAKCWDVYCDDIHFIGRGEIA